MILATLFTFLRGLVVGVLGVGAARLLILKVLLFGLVVTVLPTIIYNLVVEIFQELLNYSASRIQDVQGDFIYSATGLAGFLATYLRLPEVFSILASAFSFRVVIAFIPFVNRI